MAGLLTENSILKLTSVAFVGGLLGRGLRYLLNVIIARGIGAEALGLFALGLVVLKASALIARVGLDEAAQKYVPIYRAEDTGKLRGGILVYLVTSTVIGGVLAGVLSLAAGLLPVRSEYVPVVRLAAAGIPMFAVMMVGAAVTRGFKQTKYAVLARDVGQSGTAVVLIGLGAFGIGTVESVVLGYVASLLVGAGIAVAFVFRLVGRTDPGELTLPLRETFAFSVPLLAVNTIQYVASWTDILMLGLFVSADRVGLYQAAFQTSLLLIITLQSANAIFPPVASELYSKGNTATLARTYQAVTKWVLLGTCLLAATLILYGETVLAVFGSKFPEVQTTLVVLVLSQVVIAGTGPAGYVLSMAGYERIELLNSVVTAGLNVMLNFVLIQQLGVLGAALATGASLALLNVLRVAETRYFLGFLPYSRRYWKGASALSIALVVTYLVSLIPLPGLVGVVAGGLSSVLIFGSVMWLLGLDDDDRLLLDSVGSSP